MTTGTPPRAEPSAPPVGGSTVPSTAPPGSPRLRWFSTARVRASLREFLTLLRREQQWLWIVVPYLLAWFVPAQWCWYQWTNLSQPLAFEPWIFLGTGLLIWSRRQDLAHQWNRLTTKYPPTHRRRRGNAILLVAACILYLFSHIVQVKGITVFSLVLVALGIVYQVYGREIVKALTIPFLFFLLIIPPPDSAADGMAVRFLNASLAIASRPLHVTSIQPTGNNGRLVQMGDYSVEFDYHASGFNIVLHLCVLTLWYVLYRRLNPAYGVYLAVVGSVLGLGVNIVRIVAVGYLHPRNQALAEALHRFPAILIAVACFLAALLLMRLLSRISLRVPAPATRVAAGAGNAVTMAISPLIWLLSSLGHLGRLFTLSERKLEAGLTRLFDRKKKKPQPRRR